MMDPILWMGKSRLTEGERQPKTRSYKVDFCPVLIPIAPFYLRALPGPRLHPNFPEPRMGHKTWWRLKQASLERRALPPPETDLRQEFRQGTWTLMSARFKVRLCHRPTMQPQSAPLASLSFAFPISKTGT